MRKKICDLTLSGDTFWEMKNDFDEILLKTLSSMEYKNSSSAEITLKMEISLPEIYLPDLSIVNHTATRKAIAPRFEHKVSSVIQTKNKVSGRFNGNYELIWNEERKEYIMREINNGQMNFYDDDDTDHETMESHEGEKQ